jgi:hypothetical protein
VPQGKELNRRENIPVWSEGRSRVWAPLKVAPVSGARPEDYNHDDFETEALKNVARGFKKFRIQNVAELDRADRGFYMDFNPWLSEDGTLYVTVVVFSQFDCKTPVFSKKIVGPWESYPKLFSLASAAGEDAVIQIPAPLDNYAGEVKSGRGGLSLSKNLMVESAEGFVEIDTRGTITMGDPLLDEAIQGSMILYSKKFPAARFDIEKISGDGQPIAYGRLSPAVVGGKFSLKGKSVPLTAITEIEPVMTEDGQPRLLVRGAFKIDLRTFDIEGADGPTPARHTLVLDLNFILKEK